MKLIQYVKVLVGMVLLVCCLSIKAQVYKPQPGVAGKVTSTGSDTLANLMTLWSQEFRKRYPQVNFQIQAEGSSTAPPALIEGTSTIGPMSRELKQSEINEFVRVHGYPPTVLKVALDAIAIFVERDNPLDGLTLSQVDAIFSSTRFCGGAQTIDQWSQIGLASKYPDRPIMLFGRNSVSGTYGSFKLMALCNGDFRNTINEQPGSASVVLSVASTEGAMGYAAFGNKTAGVRALPVGQSEARKIAPTIDTVKNQTYPLTRFLYIVINKKPGEPLPTLEREFLRFILSDDGQKLVQRDGYFPVSDLLRRTQIRTISE